VDAKTPATQPVTVLTTNPPTYDPTVPVKVPVTVHPVDPAGQAAQPQTAVVVAGVLTAPVLDEEAPLIRATYPAAQVTEAIFAVVTV